MYSSIGWLLDNGDINMPQLQLDLSTLPSFLMNGFSTMDTCVDDLVTLWSSRPKRKRFVFLDNKSIKMFELLDVMLNIQMKRGR